MDVWQIVVYAVFFIIYLISKVLNNKKEQPVTRMPKEEVTRNFSDPDRPRRSPEVDLRSRRSGGSRSGGSRSGGSRSGMDEPVHRKKTGTFGEMLRDFTNADQWEQYSRKKEEEIERQRRKASERADEVAAKLKQQENRHKNKAMQKTNVPQTTLDKKLKETEKLTQGLRRMSPYQKRKNNTTARDIARTLKNPETARHAIILTEIFNRKYF